MPKLSVGDAAAFLGITKEAVYNRIRRNTLKSVDKDGVKYVIIDDTKEQEVSDQSKKQSAAKPKTTKKTERKSADESEFMKFLLAQIGELKEQNQNLHEQKDELFRQKEQILIDNKNEIAQIYKERDDKFRYFLQMLERSLIARQNGEYIQPVEVEFEENLDISADETERINANQKEPKWINLSEFLRGLNLNDKRLKKLQNRIFKSIGKSKFIKFKDGIIMVKNKKSIKKIVGEI